MTEVAEIYGQCVLDRFYTETEERAVEVAENYGETPDSQPVRIYPVVNERGERSIDVADLYKSHGHRTLYHIRQTEENDFIVVFVKLVKKQEVYNE